MQDRESILRRMMKLMNGKFHPALSKLIPSRIHRIECMEYYDNTDVQKMMIITSRAVQLGYGGFVEKINSEVTHAL